MLRPARAWAANFLTAELWREPFRVVTYRRSEIPDGLVFLEDVQVTVKWETVLEDDDGSAARFTGIDELNTLFQKKVEDIMKDKKAVCGLVRSEHVAHSVNYGLQASVMIGEYTVSLYGPGR